MKHIRYQNIGKLRGKPVLKLYWIPIITITVMSLMYFLWEKPNKPHIINRTEKDNTYFSDNSYVSSNVLQESVQPSFEGEKIVHIDLKGAPPRVSYYKELFPLLKELGVTGILIEYEDMFPYTGVLSNISALNAYSLEDIKSINEIAEENSLKVIPLVQTFGHMEFILKLSDYKNYREVPAYPQVICPTYENTMKLIINMIEQIVGAHPMAEMIHIGADEVYYLGVCDRCTDTMLKYNISKNLLFMEHVHNVVGFIKRLYPYLRVLMWDDEFRSIRLEELKKGQLSRFVEPVVWKYTKDVYDEFGPSLWEGYNQVFSKIWIASAFKGATGSNQFLSDITHYVQNHRSWLSIVSEYKDYVNFQGIIITGWQRYDHFAVLCELLPVAIPSLAMSLRLLAGYDDSLQSPPTELAKILKCDQPYGLLGPVFGTPRCSYPGGKILEYVIHLHQLKQEFGRILSDSRVKGWLTSYNIEHSFSNPNHVEFITAKLDRILSELHQIDDDIAVAMFEIYDNYTIQEWRETYIKPFAKQMYAMNEARKDILSKDSWPRRPLHDET